jgi:putative hydrolase of the HAD superfamily
MKKKHFPWEGVDTVMLDMDGTLLDKHFDDYFWEVYLPEHYSLLHDISVEEAQKELLSRYQRVEDSLQWADLDYWSHELHLDLPALKQQIDHLISLHPYVIDFLKFCKKIKKQVYLVTNAHPRTLAIKLQKSMIAPWFDRLICAEEVGFAKEEQAFWQALENLLTFDRRRSLFVDDTEKVLQTAEQHGIRYLVHIARPNSRRPSRSSQNYLSIHSFKDLLDFTDPKQAKRCRL